MSAKRIKASVGKKRPEPPSRVRQNPSLAAARRRKNPAVSGREDDFKYFFDHSVVGKSITSPSGELRINDAFLDMLGYAAEDFRKFSLRELTHPDDWADTARIMTELTAGRESSVRFIKRFLHKDGRSIWADISVVLKRNKRGEPLRYFTTVYDITDRIEAEEALMESERRFHVLFETMSEMIVIHEGVADASGRFVDYLIVDCNRVFESITGIPREQARGRLASDAYGISPAPFLEAYTEVLESGRTKVFETYFAPLARHFRVSAFALSARRFATVTTDITERKMMEKMLREDETKYRTLFETAGDAIQLMRDDIFVDCNGRSLEMFGCSDKGQFIGKPPWSFSPPAQPDGKPSVEKAKAYIAAARAGAPQRFYWRHQRLDGSPLDAEVTLNGLVLGTETFVQAIVRDIGERKRAEEEIQRSLWEKETLLREIYHRTKNNMNVIAAMLALRARAFNDPRITGLSREIDDRIRIMALVHKKLYESRDLSRIDLRAYINDLTSQLTESHKDSGITLTVHLDLEEIPVPIDTAIPCGMILNELFSNVFKHAYPGGGPGRVGIRLARAGQGSIELDFRDDGIGLPAGFDVLTHPSLGFQTLHMLVEHQLLGEITFATDHGLACHIRIPHPREITGDRL